MPIANTADGRHHCPPTRSPPQLFSSPSAFAMRPSAPVACDFGRGWDIGRPRLVPDCVDLPPQPLATMNG